ncbi:hypothetical protein JL475_35280 [Streptomyces sp. M2CJ-2]|uniref:hypothetical protein n=1 Tax=Streptomyces sp. M2CJ-2 TaxID=2803948 RepID=UPI0019268085|nr:hypothetical protein [Streptomyces sp. M2CJ-2]MBL3671105.1 hypothetical protein [Streptomyces sp. M2CJ-2]
MTASASSVVLAENVIHVEQVVLVPDRHAVQQLAPAGPHPPLHDRVHPRHPDAAEHHLDARLGEGRVEQDG